MKLGEIQARWYDLAVFVGVPVVYNAVLKSFDLELEDLWESFAFVPAGIVIYWYILFMSKRQKANSDSNTDV